MAKTPTKLNGKADSETTGAAENKAPNFAIQRIYTKDISVETPHSPLIFQEEWKPATDVQLNVSTDKLLEDVYEVKLSITITTKVGEKVAFLVEIHEAGIFNIGNFLDEQLHHMLGSYCPSVLFPFARELVSTLIARAGFPPLYLAPINFDALYAQQLAQQKEAAAGKQSSDTTQ